MNTENTFSNKMCVAVNTLKINVIEEYKIG